MVGWRVLLSVMEMGDNCLQDPFTDLKNLLGCPKILNNKNIFSFFKKSKQIGRKMKPP